MSATQPELKATVARPPSRISLSFLQNRLIGVASFLVLLIVSFGTLAPNFATFDNANTIALNGSILIVVACAEAIVVLTRNYDLSVGSIVALASYIGLDLARIYPDLGPILLVVPITIGGFCGVVNGWLVSYGRVPSVVATLGTMSIFRGLAYLYANGSQVDQKDLPGWVSDSVNGHIFGFASLPVIAVLVVAIVGILLRYLPIGRQIYAVGSNPQAAGFYGLDTRKVVFQAYVLSGLLTGLAAFLFGARVSWVVPYLAQGLELTVLAAVVIGGVSVLGGSGTVVGAAIGAVAMSTIENGLVLLGTSDFARQFIQGTAIVVAVVVDALILRKVGQIVVAMKQRGRRA
ncbi:MAG: ABC transporter permease [Fimbriimonadaceae bacterium]|nr:ABC transporter permease [Alphaproteobacteria bacterium]